MGVKELALCTIISAVFWCSVTIGTDVPQGKLDLKMVQVVSVSFFLIIILFIYFFCIGPPRTRDITTKQFFGAKRYRILIFKCEFSSFMYTIELVV